MYELAGLSYAPLKESIWTGFLFPYAAIIDAITFTLHDKVKTDGDQSTTIEGDKLCNT